MALNPRKMRYPYTLTAQIAQFPYAHYYKHSWYFRWFPIGVVMCLPLFMWISSKANSPENVAHWAQKAAKEKEAQHH